MSGHSKWATTKHKKAVVDAKRGKVFTKIIKEITVAARLAGGDTETNPRLRMAVGRAKESNMPQNNIKKAIQKGTGELPGVSYEEYTYEGYGPGGVAVIIEVMTDNKNRTVSEIRFLLSKNNGNMGENGSVSWIFQKKGFFSISKDAIDEESLMDLVLEAGADDIKTEDDCYEVYTAIESFEDVEKALAEKEIKTNISEISLIPDNYIALEGKEAEQMLRLMDRLEDNDDVQSVAANFDIADDIIEKFQNE